jgi:hypothetical protein
MFTESRTVVLKKAGGRILGDKKPRGAIVSRSAPFPYARNARTHSPEQVNQIAASIREWGCSG